MKKLIIIALLINASIIAQIKGNKKIETRTFSTENLEALKINLYAKITINNALKEGMTITADENLFDKIDTEIVDGTMNLNQLKWIQASRKIEINLSAKKLKRVETGTHDLLIIKNINKDYFNILAPLGKVIISGNVNQFNLGIENGQVDAAKLIAHNVRANIWGYGKAEIYAENEVNAILKNEGRLIFANTPKILKGDAKKAIKKSYENNDVSWIRFKIKNNSFRRNQFLVIGPKKNGNKFSYGFPMMPQATRKENWTVGTKIYKVNKLGIRKLLVKIKPEDEGKTVKLF